MANFHEQFEAGEVPMPSERSTGLVFAAVAGLMAIIWYQSPAVLVPALLVAGVLAILSCRTPHVFRPLNLLWFRFSMLLFRVTNPVVMLLMYALAIVPAGLIMQIVRDPLRARRDATAKTYWLHKTEEPSSMKHQF